MNYIWQHPQWPTFEFNAQDIAEAQQQLDVHNAFASGVLLRSSEQERQDYTFSTMVQEAVSSSQIEAETLSAEDLYQCIQYYSGKSHTCRIRDERTQCMAALMLDVNKQQGQPLTEARLHIWQSHTIPSYHAERFQLHSGRYRTREIAIVERHDECQKIIYQAPPPQDIPREMSDFLSWYNQTPPSIIKAGISHLYFECIHPYDDGNGRVGRAIATHALMGTEHRHVQLALSANILQARQEYYQQLNQASQIDTIDISRWLTWFASQVLHASKDNQQHIARILDKSAFWDKHRGTSFNKRQRTVLNKLLDTNTATRLPAINNSDYRAITGASKATAGRDLMELMNMEVLTKQGAARATLYILAGG